MGWSVAKGISNNADPYDLNNYEDINATWFFRSWWDSNRWAWIYTNDTGKSQKLVSLSFLSCAGHSNGRRFNGTNPKSSPAKVDGNLIADGGGCTYHLTIYIIHGSDKQMYSDYQNWTGRTEPINQFNCYFNGYGLTSLRTNETSFGSVTYFGPGTGYDTDTQGHRRYRYKTTIAVKKDAPVVPPGATMICCVTADEWTSSNALLVIQGSGDNFTPEIVPEEDAYIWVVNNNHQWEKKLKAHVLKSRGWEEWERK